MPSSGFPAISQSFITKKSRILSDISVPVEAYTDKSPKGSIDTPIVELINELNENEGIVTTSSCSGRVAVFVEGPKEAVKGSLGGAGKETFGEAGLSDGGANSADNADEQKEDMKEMKEKTGSPAGKGGGHWLYVSHDPVPIPSCPQPNFFTHLCGFSRPNSRSVSTPPSNLVSQPTSALSQRLIRLSYSPLILHIFCASLAHAKPLLTAAINAGFRESGVQSLKVLDEPEAGVMVGVRSMGLAFETVIGVVSEDGCGMETYECIVDEGYLGSMFNVVNERFEWNERRKKRLVGEVRRGFSIRATPNEGDKGRDRHWEDKETRWKRKREEGLSKQKQKANEKDKYNERENGCADSETLVSVTYV